MIILWLFFKKLHCKDKIICSLEFASNKRGVSRNIDEAGLVISSHAHFHEDKGGSPGFLVYFSIFLKFSIIKM